jgi:signal-transduction protein with cAMP-binding, CBS, and nucleotidyltransferase domain
MSGPFVKVSDVMRTSLHMVSGLASVEEAITLMNQHGVSSLVIERRDEHDEFGLVTVHDIAAQVIGANRSRQRTSVYQIMTKPALTINADMNVRYAMRLLSNLRINRALVTQGKELLGLVTLRDMVLGHANLTTEDKAKAAK